MKKFIEGERPLRVLIKGAGDLASGIAVRLYHSGFQVIMTETGEPTTIRRYVAFSRAVYESEAGSDSRRGDFDWTDCGVCEKMKKFIEGERPLRVLIKGAGDLASGIAVRLYHSGFQVIMTETGEPTTIRRYVAFSRAVYESEAEVEGIIAKCYCKVCIDKRSAGKLSGTAENPGHHRSDLCAYGLVSARCGGRCDPCKEKSWNEDRGCSHCYRSRSWIYRMLPLLSESVLDLQPGWTVILLWKQSGDMILEE